MVFAFAPIVGLLLGLSSITVLWETLLLSVGLYIGVPVLISQMWRKVLLARGGERALKRTLDRFSPVALLALLATLVLLFGFQGRQLLTHHRHARRPHPDPNLLVPVHGGSQAATAK
jgi:ACR3 family arsenite transporter